MKTQKKTLETPSKKKHINIKKILERINALQNITNACMEAGLDSQRFHVILAKLGKKIDREYTLLKLEAHEKKHVDQNRKYHLTMDMHEIMRVLNETRNMELTCSILGVSPLGITGFLRRNGFKIGRQYVCRELTSEESGRLAELAEARRLALREKQRMAKALKKKKDQCL